MITDRRLDQVRDLTKSLEAWRDEEGIIGRTYHALKDLLGEVEELRVHQEAKLATRHTVAQPRPRPKCAHGRFVCIECGRFVEKGELLGGTP